MSEAKAHPGTPSLEELAAEVARLRERVEDLEDARELDAAIRRNSDKALIPWEQAKKNSTCINAHFSQDLVAKRWRWAWIQGAWRPDP